MLTERIKDRLINGRVTFFKFLNSSQLNTLICEIKNSPERDVYLKGSFEKIKEQFPMYAFLLTYDLEEYGIFCKEYLNKDNTLFLDYRFFNEFIGKTRWSIQYVKDNLEVLLSKNEDLLFSIIKYGINEDDKELIQILAYHENLVIRGGFMLELADNFPTFFNKIYDNVVDFFVKYDDGNNIIEIMKEEIVSKLAVLILNNEIGEDLYLIIKDFILINYDFNILAAELDEYGHLNLEYDSSNKRFLLNDIDILFKTSKNYKYELFKKYSGYLNKKLVYNFSNKLKPFLLIDEEIISNIFSSGLGNDFLMWVEKYLEKSTGSKVITNAGKGSCTRVFKIGDYVIKCSNSKWSMEEEICPRNYLIIKNFEEVYVRNDLGEVTGAIEVQKYLSKSLSINDSKLQLMFLRSLLEDGLVLKDGLVDTTFGSNCFYLDSYLDADCDNPEVLPSWFKKDPIVLVDRDLIFKKENKNPRIRGIKI